MSYKNKLCIFLDFLLNDFMSCYNFIKGKQRVPKIPQNITAALRRVYLFDNTLKREYFDMPYILNILKL